MLPLPSERVLDAIVDALFLAALRAQPPVQDELALACRDLADADRKSTFVTIVLKGWYFDVSGDGASSRWDGPHAGSAAARAAAQRYVAFSDRLLARCTRESDLAFHDGASAKWVPLFSFVARLGAVGVVPVTVALAYALKLVVVENAEAAAQPLMEGRVSAWCAMMVSAGPQKTS